jgi:gliding motility-associated lipoprotein GldH
LIIKSIHSIFSLGILILFISCEQNDIYRSEALFSDSEWFYADTKHFDFLAEDTTGRFDLIMDIRHSREFDWQNLYLRITTVFPGGNETKEVFPIDFADGSGKWYGRCRKNHCLLGVVLQENFRFEQNGIHTLHIEQYMRENPIRGISKIGLTLQKHTPAN